MCRFQFINSVKCYSTQDSTRRFYFFLHINSFYVFSTKQMASLSVINITKNIPISTFSQNCVGVLSSFLNSSQIAALKYRHAWVCQIVLSHHYFGQLLYGWRNQEFMIAKKNFNICPLRHVFKSWSLIGWTLTQWEIDLKTRESTDLIFSLKFDRGSLVTGLLYLGLGSKNR